MYRSGFEVDLSWAVQVPCVFGSDSDEELEELWVEVTLGKAFLNIQSKEKKERTAHSLCDSVSVKCHQQARREDRKQTGGSCGRKGWLRRAVSS